MNHNFGPDNAAEIWKDQQTEGTSFSPDVIRRRAEQLKKNVRRQDLVGKWAVATWLGTAIVSSLLPPAHPARLWLLAAQLAAMCFWFIHHEPSRALDGSRLLTLGLDSGAGNEASCLDFYRGQLQFQRDRVAKNLAMIPILVVLLFAASLGLWIYRSAVSALPFAIPLLLLLVGYVRSRREAPTVQRHIDQLEAFRRASL